MSIIMYSTKRRLKYYYSLVNFYLIVLLEGLFFPFFFFRNVFFNQLSVFINRRGIQEPVFRTRKDVVNENFLAVCIHEWGGYGPERAKIIRGRKFICGMKYQIQRIKSYSGKIKLETSITISDAHLYKHTEILNPYKIIEVENMSMDFSGYSKFVKDLPVENQCVLLMNSSVSARQIEFIDDYMQYFKDNIDVGLLGISYSSKSYQTLVKNNFKPHIQSFFILTTSDVLREIIALNKGFFPGSTSLFKLSIIKNGEMKISKLALKLGYKIAAVTEQGAPIVFFENSWFDNGYGRWNRPLGDCRLYVENINSINKLT